MALATLASGALLATPGYQGDIAQFKAWSRRVALDGIASAYRVTGDFDPDHPPVPLYLYGLVGHAYQSLQDPSFDWHRALASRAFTAGIKALGVVFHLAAAALLYVLVSRQAGPGPGRIACAAYALNPAVLYDVAHWGELDSLPGLLLVLAIGCVLDASIGLAGLWFGVALMTKPQAWALLPVFLVADLRSGVRAFGRALASTLTGAIAPLVPFIVAGRMHEVLALPDRIRGGMPFATVDAHNFWWLATLGANWERFRAYEPIWGPLTPREVALLLLLGVTVLASLLVWRRGTTNISAAAAYLAFGWYMVTVQVHENHSFLALPLLALVLHRARVHRVAFAVISSTLFVDLFLHSPEIWGSPTLESYGGRWWASMANTAANLALFGYWTRRVIQWTERTDASLA